MFDQFSSQWNESVPDADGDNKIADLLGQLTQIRKEIERDSTLSSCETSIFEKNENGVERDPFYLLLSKTHSESGPQHDSASPLPETARTWQSNPMIPPEVKPVTPPLPFREETGERPFDRQRCVDQQRYVDASQNHGTRTTSPSVSPEKRPVKKKRTGLHETATLNEAVVIPIQEARKRWGEMGKKVQISQRPQRKPYRSEDKWTTCPIRKISADRVPPSTWPPAFQEDQYLLNGSGMLGRFLLIAGWGLVTCGFLLYLRNLFISRGFWQEYSFPLLGFGAFLLLIGIVIEFLMHKSHLVNELQYRVAMLKQKVPAKKHPIPEKKYEYKIENESDDDEIRQLEANYQRLLELRDEIDILLEGVGKSSL
ncbi:MAG: hypothetical protein FWC50_10345 [Planctomycetaceae bacterium]|nr:hypothetical protein [Planctomycetaceae bacterium]